MSVDKVIAQLLEGAAGQKLPALEKALEDGQRGSYLLLAILRHILADEEAAEYTWDENQDAFHQNEEAHERRAKLIEIIWSLQRLYDSLQKAKQYSVTPESAIKQWTTSSKDFHIRGAIRDINSCLRKMKRQY